MTNLENELNKIKEETIAKKTKKNDEVSIFSDLDLVNLQNDRAREVLLMKKIQLLRKKYFTKVKLIHALEDQLLLTKEFRDINKYKYLKLLSNQADELEEDFRDDDSLYSKEEKIINDADEENLKLHENRKERMFPTITNLGQNRKTNQLFIQIPKTRPTCCRCGLWNYFVKFLLIFAPFKDCAKYIKYNFNTTIVLLFDILRFLFIMTCFSAVIFLYFYIFHIIKFKNSNPGLKIGTFCKFAIPCFMLYGSINDPLKDGINFSITYGVWVIFLFLGMIIFYYRNDSNRKKENIFKKFTKFSELSTYFFNSWDMKTCTFPKARSNRKQILKNVNVYHNIYTLKLKRDDLDRITSNWIFFILANFIYLICLAIIGALVFFTFQLRHYIRNKNDRKGHLKGRNAFADLLPLILSGLYLHAFPELSYICCKFESLTQPIYKTISKFIKKLITKLLIIFIIIYIHVQYTLKGKQPFKPLKDMSSFACHGKKNMAIFPTLQNLSVKLIKQINYSRCKEDEVGTNFFYIAIFYCAFNYLKELFLFIIYKLSKRPKRKIKYQPFDVLLNVYTQFILNSIVVYFVPYFLLFSIIILLIEFFYQYYKVKYRCNHKYDDLTVQRRNNTYPIIVSFMWLNALNMIFVLYFYLNKFPLSVQLQCWSNNAFVAQNYTNYTIGPISMEGTSLANGFSEKLSNAKFIGKVYDALREAAIIFILICVIIGATFFKNYSPSKQYYDFIVIKQKRLIEYLTLLNEHLVRRDIITSVLLKTANKRKKN